MLVQKSGIKPNYSFIDVNGKPGGNYTYKVRAFKQINQTYYSTFDSTTINFPMLSAPTACSATDGLFFNHVAVTWQYPSGANTGFIIYRQGAPLDTIGSTNTLNPTKTGAGIRHYIDLFNNPETILPDTLTYYVRAYQIRKGVWYLSDSSNWDIGFAGIQVFSNLNSVTGTTGNENLGRSVAMGPEFAIAGTGAGVQSAQTFVLDANSNFSQQSILNPIPASGTDPAFGWDVAVYDNQVAVSAPWAWSSNSTEQAYRSGEVYVYSDSNGILTAPVVIRNSEFKQETKSRIKNYNSTKNISFTESNAWCTISGYNYVNKSSVGAADTGIGSKTGAMPYYSYAGLAFIANDDFYLDSVTVYPSTSGTVNVRVLQGGPAVFTKSIAVSPSVPFEATRIAIGERISQGSGYTIDAFGSCIDPVGACSGTLLYNSAGASYPYNTANGTVTITGRTGGGSPGIYNFFYDWAVSKIDTLGTRCHVDTTVYSREVILDTIEISFPETETNLDIRLVSVTLDIQKSGSQGVWIENMTLEKVGGPSIRLFSTNSDPASCAQDTVRATFDRTTAGNGLVSASATCLTALTDTFTPIDGIDATFNNAAVDPSGLYRIRYTVKLIDPNPLTRGTLASTTKVTGAVLGFETLPGGIHQGASQKNAQFGYSVGLNGSMLAGGAPYFDNFKGSVKSFKKDTNGVWSIHDTLLSPSSLASSCGDYTINVIPDINAGSFLTWNLYDAGNNQIANGIGIASNVPVHSTNTPLTLSIQASPVLGFIDYNVNVSVVGNGSTILTETVVSRSAPYIWTGLSAPCPGSLKGHALAMTKDKLITGAPSTNVGDGNGARGEVQFYQLNNDGDWSLKQNIFITNPGYSDDQFGYSVEMDDDVLAVGAKGDDWDNNAIYWDAGSVSLYTYDASNSEYTFKRKIWNPDDPKKTYEFFGYDIAILNNLMAVGAPGVDATGGVANAGAVYIYEKDDNDNWIFKKRYFAPDPETDANFGSSVALSGNTLMVGAPNFGGSDVGKVYFIYVRDQIDSVIASDGTEGTKTRVSWVYNGLASNIKVFNVYRDSSLIASIDPNKNFMFDYDGVPGQKYVYQVRPVSLDDVEGIPKGDIGWSAPNGILDGKAVTLLGYVGVEDVNIEAFATVDGEVYHYKTTTDGNGDYKITNVYYGDSTTYYIHAYLWRHEFRQDTLTKKLNLQQNQGGIDPFIDMTAYVVKGVAKYDNTDCGIDSISVIQHTYKKDSTIVDATAYTDPDGNFSFNIQPYDPEVDHYEYSIDSVRVLVTNSDTTYFNFGSNPSPLTRLDTMGRVTNLEPFNEITTYPVQIFVQTSCGPIDDPIPHQWQVQIRSKDGCYSKDVLTDNSGRLLLHMAPLDYSFRVVSVTNPNTTTLVAIDYLKVRPRSLDVQAFHKSLKGAKTDTTLPMDFVFHVIPNITSPNLSGFLCGDPNLPVVIDQGKSYSLNFEVRERFGANNCPVSEGYLIIRNDAAQTSTTRIDYDPKTLEFPAYNFIAAGPNPVSPYVKWMYVEYHTDADGFLGEMPVAYIVQGVAQVPGNDVIVNPDSDGSQLLLPFFVLRDPPGDGSYSTIDSGSTFESNLSVSENHTFSRGVTLEFTLLWAGNGIKVGLDQAVGGGFENETNYTVTTETTKSFSTSSSSDVDNATNSEWLTGDAADVLVGGGLALAYGIGREIHATDTCTVVSVKAITTGASIKTTWIYTVDQIRNLIREYTDNIEAARNGLYKIDGKTQDETIDFLTVRKMNWEQMMKYHDLSTLPHYEFCDPQNFANIPEPWATAAANWRKKGFCEKIGSYTTENGKEVFVMNSDTTWQWDSDLLNRYNAVKQQVRNIDDYLDYTGALNYSESRLNQVTIDQAYNAAFGPDAKNITFSGGTSYTESRSISQSKGTSYKQFWNNDTKISLGTASKSEVTLYMGAWAGFGAGTLFQSKLKAFEWDFDLSTYFQYQFEYNETKSTTQGHSQNVSYTLEDDDPGDQYSVTIVNGAIPTQTPYFALTGGRTSCPHEPGAINRDIPHIDVMDAYGNSKNRTQYDQDPNKPVNSHSN